MAEILLCSFTPISLLAAIAEPTTSMKPINAIAARMIDPPNMYTCIYLVQPLPGLSVPDKLNEQD